MLVDKNDVVEYRRTFPKSTLQEVGNKFGVSRERIRQILLKAGEPTKSSGWGELVPPKLCEACKIHHTSGPRIRFCDDLSCRFNRIYIMMTCDNCGREFARRRMDLRRSKKVGSELTFCDRMCLGQHAGNNYGFASGKVSGGKKKFEVGEKVRIVSYIRFPVSNSLDKALKTHSEHEATILSYQTSNKSYAVKCVIDGKVLRFKSYFMERN